MKRGGLESPIAERSKKALPTGYRKTNLVCNPLHPLLLRMTFLQSIHARFLSRSGRSTKTSLPRQLPCRASFFSSPPNLMKKLLCLKRKTVNKRATAEKEDAQTDESTELLTLREALPPPSTVPELARGGPPRVVPLTTFSMEFEPSSGRVAA